MSTPKISLYLIINSLFVLPVFLLNEIHPDIYPRVYIVLITMYYIFSLVYVHLFLDIVSICYSVFLLFRKKKSLKIFMTLTFVAIINALLNIYWLINGAIWAIQ